MNQQNRMKCYKYIKGKCITMPLVNSGTLDVPLVFVLFMKMPLLCQLSFLFIMPRPYSRVKTLTGQANLVPKMPSFTTQIIFSWFNPLVQNLYPSSISRIESPAWLVNPISPAVQPPHGREATGLPPHVAAGRCLRLCFINCHSVNDQRMSSTNRSMQSMVQAQHAAQ